MTLFATSSASTPPPPHHTQKRLGGIGGECWRMHSSQGRLSSRGDVTSQCRAPGLHASASTKPVTRVAVQSWMTIVLFVAEIYLSTCDHIQESNCTAGKYQFTASLQPAFFTRASPLLMYVTAVVLLYLHIFVYTAALLVLY
jgi:hypothetical protein